MLSDDELAAIAEIPLHGDVPRLVAEIRTLRAEIMWYREELHGYHVTEALRWSKTEPEMEDCPRCAALDDRAPRETSD